MEKKYPYLSEDGKTIFLAPGYATETKEEWEKREQLPPPPETINISPETKAFIEERKQYYRELNAKAKETANYLAIMFAGGAWNTPKEDYVTALRHQLRLLRDECSGENSSSKGRQRRIQTLLYALDELVCGNIG